MNRHEFGVLVSSTISQHPDWSKTANEAIQSGLDLALDNSARRAANWETVAVLALQRRLPKRDAEYIAALLEQLQPDACSNLESLIKELKK